MELYLAGSEAASTGSDSASHRLLSIMLLARPVVRGRSGTRHLLDRFGERKPNVVMSTIGIEIHARCNRYARSFRILRQNDKLSFVNSATSA